MLTLYIDSHNVLEIEGLKNSIDDAACTDATITATIRDRSGDLLTGESWPVTLSHVAAGTYRHILDSAVSVKEQHRYKVRVEATSPTVGDKVWEEEISPVYAGAD